MEIDGAAAGAPPATPQSALPPVASGEVGTIPPAPPPVETPESGAPQGGAASATLGQAAAPMAVETTRPEDLDWWVSPNPNPRVGWRAGARTGWSSFRSPSARTRS